MFLKGKSALVTGSTSGIGLATARAFAAEGANVTINGFGEAAAIERERAALESEFGVTDRYSAADMTRPDQIAEMVAQHEAAYGTLDILVNNAGIKHVSPIEAFPIDKWDATTANYMSSAFQNIRAALPCLKVMNWGRCFNTDQ